MRISAEYMNLLQSRLDMIGNNLANANTNAFKQQLLSEEEGADVQEQSKSRAMYGEMAPGIASAGANFLYLTEIGLIFPKEYS
jgi:flagellar basal body rod protein FlgG